MTKFVISLLKFYKTLVSPVLVNCFGHSCRFAPTCSQYMDQAISSFGLYKGAIVGVKRILRCNPFGGIGFDPVNKS